MTNKPQIRQEKDRIVTLIAMCSDGEVSINPCKYSNVKQFLATIEERAEKELLDKVEEVVGEGISYDLNEDELEDKDNKDLYLGARIGINNHIKELRTKLNKLRKSI